MQKKSQIKIFVSHHIDLDAEMPDNPLYIPVRSGAVFDKNEVSSIIGDNTGDNISEKRMSFCELTVLYWAWKNQTADYMGLCHYRRYLSPNKELTQFAKGEHNAGCISVDSLDADMVKMYNLNEADLKNEIENYDAVFVKPINLEEFNRQSNYEAMKHSPEWHNMEWTDIAISIAKDKYPEMLDTIDEYLYKHKYSYLYNCFVMKKEIFNSFCTWFFDILFELEKNIDVSLSSQALHRTCGVIGEHFLGIWVLWMKKNNYKINELPLLFIEHPEAHPLLHPKSNHIALCASSSNEYVPYLSVYLQSIGENTNKSNNYDIIIFERSITQENKEKLLTQVSRFSNLSLRFVNPTPYLKKYDLKYPPYYNLECFFRLTAPLVLKNYKKVIFTDIDMVLMKDLKELYDIDIEGYPLAACKDLIWGSFLNNIYADWKEYAVNKLKLDKPFEYYNTGVMVLNIEEFNKNNYSEKILELVNKENYRILEQDGLNAFFQTNIKYIDTAWNFPIANIRYKTFLPLMPCSFLEQYKKDRENPKIIHYAGRSKPWFYPDEDLAYIWWEYARKTPFYEEILARMVEAKRPPNKDLSKLLYISFHQSSFYLKKFIYKFKKAFMHGKKREKYKNKYKAIKSLLKEAKRFRKQVMKM